MSAGSVVEFYSLPSAPTQFTDRTVVVAEALEPLQVVDFVKEKQCRHLLQKNEAYYEEDVENLTKVIQDPRFYFEERAETLVKTRLAKHSIEFSGSQDKSRLKSECESFIAKVKNQALEESLNVVVEELYMNAVIDAPREYDESGAEYRLSVPRKRSEMRLVLSNNRLALSCYDPFGSLRIQKFIDRLHEVYKKGAGEAIQFREDGGAGIGCALIFEHCSSLFLGVISGRVTVVSCLIPVGLGYRQRAKIKKSLHLFQF